MDFQTIAIAALILAALIVGSIIQRKAKKAVEEGEVDASAKLGLTPVTPALTPDPRWIEIGRSVGCGQIVAIGEMEGRQAYLGTHFSTAGQVRRGRTRIGMTENSVSLVFGAQRSAPSKLLIKQRLPALLQSKRPSEPTVPTGDAAFDERFEIFCDDQTWALKVLDESLRQPLLAARSRVAGGKEDAAGWAGVHTAMFFGEFQVADDVVMYRWNRGLNDESIARLKEFAPLLAELAKRVEATA